MKTHNIIVLLLLLLTGVRSYAVDNEGNMSSRTTSDGLSILRERYTTEHPLIYEDAWEKWPYVFINDDGEPDGFNVELIKEMMRRLNIPYKILLKDQSEAHNDLRNGRAQLSFGVAASYNAPWGQFGRVTVALFENAMLQPRQDSLHPLNINDLRDKHFVVSRGSRAYHYIIASQIDDSLITTVDNMEAEILRGASTGKGNYIWNTMMTKWVVNKYHLDDFSVTPIDIPPGEYRLMSSDTLLLHCMDSVAERIKAEGEIDRMINRWMYPEKKEPSNITLPIVAGLLFVIILLFTIVSFVRYYRKYYSRNSLQDIHSQMELILRSNQIKVWVYYPLSRTYAWMDANGRVDREYSSFEFSQFYPEGDFNIIHTQVMEFLSQEQKPVDKILRSYSPADNKTILDVEVHMEVMKDDYGKIYLICGVQYDITDSKAALERMRLLHERHRVAFNLAVGGVMRFDADGTMIDINDRMLKKVGINDREKLLARKINIKNFGLFDGMNIDELPNDYSFCTYIKNKDMFKYMPFADVDAYNPDFNAYPHFVSKEERDSKDFSISDTGYYYLHFVKSYDTAGHFICYMLYIRDITAEVEKQRRITRFKKHAEWMQGECKLYRDSRDFVLSEFNIWMLHYHSDTKRLSILDRSSNKRMEFTQLQILEMIDSSHMKKVFKILHRVDSLDPSDLHITVGTLIRNKKGEQCYFNIDAHPMYDSNGTISGYFGICTDITSQIYTQKQLESETRKAHEAEHVKQNFLKNMSYSIRQPLVTMQQSIEKLGATDEAALQTSIIDDITLNTKRLIMLSDDTLLLSRIEAGLFVLNEEQLDFVPVFLESVEQGLLDYRSDNVTHNIVNTYDSLPLTFDKKVLSRILIEAVGLSARYTSFGTITVRYMHRKGLFTIAIEDNGQGIPPAILEHIYEPRLGDTYTSEMRKHHISGLEMPICKALVELLNGTIEIESDPGRGTSIYITLPIE